MEPDKGKRKKTKVSLVVEPDLWAEFKAHSALKRVDASNGIAQLMEAELNEKHIYTREELHALADEIVEKGGDHVAATLREFLTLLLSVSANGRQRVRRKR